MLKRFSLLLALGLLPTGTAFTTSSITPRDNRRSRIRSRVDSSSSSSGAVSLRRPNTSLQYAVDDLLDGLGIPSGLKDTLLTNAHDVFTKRIWIVDNSGSMAMHDGHQVMDKDAECTRWEELQETVKCHSQFAAALQAPTEFRLLNPPKNGGPKSFRVGYGGLLSGRDTKRAESIISKSKPQGMTPLHTRIKEIRREVVRMAPQLEQDGTKITIVIATDGCNHDRQNMALDAAEVNKELLEALESLQGLPVWVVIRLCTDFEPIVDFYNSLDERLDLNLDVLDDHIAEAAEVNLNNKWLNYALVLHRMREMGMSNPVFDVLDQRALTREEIRDFCGLLFGPEKMPHPNCDWPAFVDKIAKVQEVERMHWNPRVNKLTPWIDVSQLALVDEDVLEVEDALVLEAE